MDEQQEHTPVPVAPHCRAVAPADFDHHRRGDSRRKAHAVALNGTRIGRCVAAASVRDTDAERQERPAATLRLVVGSAGVGTACGRRNDLAIT